MVRARISSAGNKLLSRSYGFTLFELIVVLVLAAGITALSTPIIAKALPGAELKFAARQLAAALRYARTYALSKDEEAVLTIDVETRTFEVTGRSQPYHISDDLVVTLVAADSEMLSDNKGGIRFYPEGGSTGGRISVQTEKKKLEVDVDWLTGKVRIYEGEPDA